METSFLFENLSPFYPSAVPAADETVVPQTVATVIGVARAQNCGECAVQGGRVGGNRIDIDQWVRDYHEMVARFARLNLIEKMEDKSMTVW